MGKAIEAAASERGHEIVARVDVGTSDSITGPEVVSADVAIEFTTPGTAVSNYRTLLGEGVPVVSGTTGWRDKAAEVENLVASTPGARMFWASNYSIGVNIFFRMNRILARVMDGLDAYTPSVHEVHHVHKLDHPSGTAVTIAEDICGSVSRLEGWSEEYTPGKIAVSHERIGETPGTHRVTWDSETDIIRLEHESRSRKALALGAVLAAEWLVKANPGMYGMEDMLDDVIGRTNLING